MINFQIDSWAAIAPGLSTEGDWIRWFSAAKPLIGELEATPLKQFHPMIRRRFGRLGKCAMGAVLQVLSKDVNMPSVFASRHGDAELTVSLLKGIAANDDMSPTDFSLAVHNAVSGLCTIARKDTSTVTSIASVKNLTVQALIESIAQLQDSEKVLCVMYDLPLPAMFETYQDYDFPYAIAFILTRCDKGGLLFKASEAIDVSNETSNEPLNFIRFLVGECTQFSVDVGGVCWVLKDEAD